jgi:hypothetical protein
VEASTQGQRIRVVLEYEVDGSFRVGARERFDPRDPSFEEIAAGIGGLEARLREELAADPALASVEVESVALRRGSVVLEVLAVLHQVGTWVAYFGGVVQGLDYLTRAIHRAARPFLATHLPLYALAAGHAHLLPPLVQPPAAPRRPEGTTRVLLYLLATNAVLVAVVIMVVIVRGG